MTTDPTPATTPAPNPLTSCLPAALGYAARGWRVIPLHHAVSFGPKTGPDRARCSCGRSGCESQGKHPRPPAWQKAATTDPETIAAWWATWPEANVGIATGHGLDVLDLDGDEALDVLDAATPAGAGALDGPMATTGRGVHIYLGSPGDLQNRGPIVGMPACDWRGIGGQAVAPPSVHHTGERYLWGAGHGPDRSVMDCPQWLRERVLATRQAALPPQFASPVEHGARAGRYAEAALEGELGRLVMARQGGRNHALNAAAFSLGQLIAAGELDERIVIAELWHAANRIGLTDNEIKQTIASGLKSGATTPRRRRESVA